MTHSPLAADEIERFYTHHLPYRLKLLLAHAEYCTASPVSGSDSHFIASIITGRVFLNFLGITKGRSRRLGRYDRKGIAGASGSDVLATDLYGEFVPLSRFDDVAQAKICDYIVMADKAAAHLTSEMDHDWSVAQETAILIFELLREHLYGQANRPSPTLVALGFKNLAINAGELS